MRQSERHHTQTTHTTRHNTTTSWEMSQRSCYNLHRHRQRCAAAKVATRCELKWPPGLHHELSPSSCTHMVVDLSAPMLLWYNTSVAAPMKPPILATLRGGPHLIHWPPPHSLPMARISKTAKKVTPLLSHHKDHCCTRANPATPPWALCTSLPTTSTGRGWSPDATPPRRLRHQ
jgi:hypothetical protein